MRHRTLLADVAIPGSGWRSAESVCGTHELTITCSWSENTQADGCTTYDGSSAYRYLTSDRAAGTSTYCKRSEFLTMQDRILLYGQRGGSPLVIGLIIIAVAATILYRRRRPKKTNP